MSKLRGMDTNSSMPGELHWEVGYFGEPQFRPAMRSHGKDVNLPKELRDKKELQDDKVKLDTSEEDAVVHTPPDPLWPSGVCIVIVHQIANLELQNIKGSEGKRKGREFEPVQESGENKDEESKKLPSSYRTILFNDELVGHKSLPYHALHCHYTIPDNVTDRSRSTGHVQKWSAVSQSLTQVLSALFETGGLPLSLSQFVINA